MRRIVKLLAPFRTLLRIALVTILSLVAWCLWFLDGPAPARPILWIAVVGTGETRPDAGTRFLALPGRDGIQRGYFDHITFWRDDLVYWSRSENAFGILPPAGPLRWAPFPGIEPDDDITKLRGCGDGIVASVERNTPEGGRSTRFFFIPLPSGAVHEIADAVAADCCAYSNWIAVETPGGHLELRNGKHRRPLVAPFLGPEDGWQYDFQNHLLCTIHATDGTI